ncbi:precorrin-4 C11-methyltransferase [Rubrobacter radiotolerans]|uniref:Precorrin-4 C(11)-methyltransferase n=1 Tax=Rubrobacter radiotolerans TaxID=42256 RepID=A0A023X1P4_RUBRA|nr:precorrin-4 C(11)-methyltransferase [Rubrobacter radiotolerans]AHY46101.1 precorrin-4 C11-methyltransferase [Rubrobacter radiotolerans]MDX5893511.1 precorrin-4 C(11)-methyltransferase [Rubrobacter radiotolerans]SMC03884.1 precorrin-4/cobalt-precorrin-4 C11-methyltransferase [Rubrobacter radiotolerans DSM 5868]
MERRTTGKVWFVGAGPGAEDLITVRGARIISEADVVLWARSLVSERVLEYASPEAELVESTDIPLEGAVAVYERAAREGLAVARVHSGDPAIFGAILEQIERCEALGLEWEIVPGVSSFSAAAAAVGRELTVPEVAQSIILTRRASRTPMPEGQEIERFARHGTTMAIFLSAARPRELQEELLAGGYPPHTPCAVVYRASWPDQLVERCTLSELGETVRRMGVRRQTMILVGPGLDAYGKRSRLYDPSFSHMFRKGTDEALRDVERGRSEGVESR